MVQSPVRGSRPWWSPDGNLLYFLSNRDRFFCIRAQRLDPATKRLIGDAIPVLHFRETRRHTRRLTLARPKPGCSPPGGPGV